MKIVLSRLDRVGDLVLSTPAIASVRRSWPQAEIAIACSQANAVVLERNPDIDRIVRLAPGDDPRAFGRREHGADIAIALAPCAPDFALVGATRAPLRVGYTYVRRFVARATARFFLTRLGISEADPALCERDPAYRVRHEVEQVLDLVRLAGGSARARELVLPIGEDDRRAVAAVPAQGLAFHLGRRWTSAGSTLASTLELLASLRERIRPLVVTYGADGREAAEAIRASALADAVAGDVPFGAWAAIFEKSRLVVTVDTGATHVASAVRRPTVVLFEHRYFRLSSQEWSPYRVPGVCIRKPAEATPEGLRATRAEIVAAVEELLRAEEPARTAP
ncbi:MAG: glycosyltransferase family 9 protein [Vulcanimicrobiaceae bacterium]